MARAKKKTAAERQTESLTNQQILSALRALKRGDFDVRLPEDYSGIQAQICQTFNAVSEMAQGMTGEVSTLRQKVGTEGRTSLRLAEKGFRGGWGSISECINEMLDDLTMHSAEIARVVTSVGRGDLSQRIDLQGEREPLQGDFLKDAKAVNGMVDQLEVFGSEVTRVARQVGIEGKLGAQADIPGVSGSWRELTDSVNQMASNLTSQVREIARVTTAVAQGDLTQAVDIEARGEILELKKTINTMIDQLGSFADEVTRVAREVGTEGQLGGQAQVKGVSGTWKELTQNVNSMANNLTGQVRNIAEVVTAIANGDLSKKITVDAKGEILALKSTINDTVDKLGHFSEEVTRVARLVGTEGTLGVQADVKGVSGIWRELTNNVNQMGRNLTDQVRDIAQVTTAVANGDLSKKITVEVKGEILELKNTINAMVDSLSAFADEVTRMARDVGTEGVLGGQAEVRDVSGIWRELTDNVNSMANNLTNQVRNLSEVATAVANGDLTKKITVDAKGEILELKSTINTMVDQLSSFADEVTRVSREVGVEGKLGGQAEVEDVKGTWKELTNNVNLMATNLTNQVRDIAQVTTAVARGDLTRKITVEARGEILELKNTINTMVDQLGSFADEVTRLAVEVGVEGKLGGQADVRGVLGTWRELTDAVNSMATNLTDQVRSVFQVSTAIAEGDLRKKIKVEARGEIAELKSTINTMVDQLNAFADEVSRVAREVGVEGKLGGQAEVPGVSGTWKELTDNVNSMATNLTDQVRDIAEVTTAVAQGDLSRKISVEVRGELAELKDTINTMVDQLNAFAGEVTRVAREVGTEGKLGGQAEVRGVSGTWKELTDNVNLMASNLTDQVRDIAEVTTAVAQGDLSRKITVEVRGELAELKRTINTMVDQLSSFADEVTRVAREVGMEGVLGGQAQVKGVSGIWKELTGNVNLMAANLTEQVRGIARVVTAVATGDLEQKLQLDVRGEIAALVDTINGMIVTLSTFADEVTRVAREVGVEGKLGGQADVPGAAGGWRDLTDNVNELAGNLTRQVRAIGDVATAVTKGDLTRAIDVEASGEVAELKDNLNQMIETLAETTQANEEQDWLKTNLTRFSRMLQGQRDLLTVSEQVLSELATVVDAQHGAFYMNRQEEDAAVLKLFASYAFKERKELAHRFEPGEGLVGQAALEKKRIHVADVPEGYVEVASGLGKGNPRSLVVVPILFEEEVKGVIELASFQPFTRIQLAFLDQLLESLGIVIATIEATMRTDELLRQSQTMAEELQTQQDELQQTNEELEEKARLLTEQRDEVETKNREVELAKQEVEEKAEQLALTSKYKSQFLANMSHELRTPLNSLLILSRQLAANSEDHLDPREVEYAETIHQAGADLLDLINEILDLAKIESGTIAINPHEIRFESLEDYVERTFRQMAEQKGLDFRVETDEELPSTLVTDDIRLKQILRNLLSNAFKFTDEGEVHYRVDAVDDPRILDRPIFSDVDEVIAFSVRDTGIGIPKDKHHLVFEAFQQADGGTSRKYGGTGLGLSISREIAQLLGGFLTLGSEPGEGSVFTLYLPRVYRDRPKAIPAAIESREDSSRLTPEPVPRVSLLDDDRHHLEAGTRVLLIVEDDEAFAKILLEMAREHGFQGVVAARGAEAFRLARTLEPDAITLDLVLPDMDGWVLLDRLKHDPDLRHIPVHVISVAGEERRGLERGAVEVIAKPVEREEIGAAFDRIQEFLERKVKRLLVVEDDETQRESIVTLIGNSDVETVTAETAEEALEELASGEPFDCMVLDLNLPDMSGMDLIQRMEEDRSLQRVPVVVYTGKELSPEERIELERLAETVIVKDARSPERLLDETALFLHRVEKQLPEPKRRILRSLALGDPALEGKKVLVVDDDVRNIFAITAVLEHHGMEVVYAENGRQGLERLEEHEDVDIVLMDIMMPEMDGYEAMGKIRERPESKDLPIIALTAKAMKGDREKCIDAGASDYVTKPVEPEQLASLLRVWLYR